MNVLDQIRVKQNPFEWLCEPQPVCMQRREIEVLPALVSELVGAPIDSVTPTVGVGRVLIFSVSPHERKDPPLVFCRCVDLSEYYRLWKAVVEKRYTYYEYTPDLVSEYTGMMKSLNISELNHEEAAFLFVELLKFKNEYVRRA